MDRRDCLKADLGFSLLPHYNAMASNALPACATVHPCDAHGPSRAQ